MVTDLWALGGRGRGRGRGGEKRPAGSNEGGEEGHREKNPRLAGTGGEGLATQTDSSRGAAHAAVGGPHAQIPGQFEDAAKAGRRGPSNGSSEESNDVMAGGGGGSENSAQGKKGETNFMEQNVISSAIGGMLLYRNQPGEEASNKFNSFYSLAVNTRIYLEQSSLCVYETDEEARANLVLRLCSTKNTTPSPLASATHRLVVVSFTKKGEPTPNRGTDITKLFLVQKGATSNEHLHATPVTQDIIREALKWLLGEELFGKYYDRDKSVEHNVGKFISEMEKIPNGCEADLENFIRTRKWEGGPCLWGGLPDEYLALTWPSSDSRARWRALRQYIIFNMARQTKILVCPVDSLHRCAVSSNTFNGLPPPGAGARLKDVVKTFSKKLKPSSTNPNHLCIEETGGEGESTDIELDLRVPTQFCVPDEINESFCVEMTNLSALSQADLSLQKNHTVMNMGTIFLKHLENFLLEKEIHFLSHGVDRILLGLDTFPDPTSGGSKDETIPFKDFLQTEFPKMNNDELQQSVNDVRSWFKATKTKTMSKEEWPTGAWLAEWFVLFWLDKFSQGLYHATKDFTSRMESVARIDKAVELELVSSLKVQEFQRIFKTCRANGGPPPEGGDVFRLDCEQLGFTENMHPILHWAKKHTVDFENFFSSAESNPWKKYRSSKRRENEKIQYLSFSAPLLEWSWIMMYAFLSPQSHKAIKNFLDPPYDTHTHPQDITQKRDRSDLARKACRCLVLTVSTSVKASHYFWTQAKYFQRTERGFPKSKKTLANRMRAESETLYLTISAVRHACNFFQKTGHFPKRVPDSNDGEAELLNSLDLRHLASSLQDPISRNTILFTTKLVTSIQEMKKESTTWEDDCRRAIEKSVGRDFLSGDKAKGLSLLEKEGDSFIGNWTAGGNDSYSMAPSENLRPESSAMEEVESLLGLIGCDPSDEEGFTHRIGEMVEQAEAEATLITLGKVVHPPKGENVNGERPPQKASEENREEQALSLLMLAGGDGKLQGEGEPQGSQVEAADAGAGLTKTLNASSEVQAPIADASPGPGRPGSDTDKENDAADNEGEEDAAAKEKAVDANGESEPQGQGSHSAEATAKQGAASEDDDDSGSEDEQGEEEGEKKKVSRMPKKPEFDTKFVGTRFFENVNRVIEDVAKKHAKFDGDWWDKAEGIADWNPDGTANLKWIQKEFHPIERARIGKFAIAAYMEGMLNLKKRTANYAKRLESFHKQAEDKGSGAGEEPSPEGESAAGREDRAKQLARTDVLKFLDPEAACEDSEHGVEKEATTNEYEKTSADEEDIPQEYNYSLRTVIPAKSPVYPRGMADTVSRLSVRHMSKTGHEKLTSSLSGNSLSQGGKAGMGPSPGKQLSVPVGRYGWGRGKRLRPGPHGDETLLGLDDESHSDDHDESSHGGKAPLGGDDDSQPGQKDDEALDQPTGKKFPPKDHQHSPGENDDEDRSGPGKDENTPVRANKSKDDQDRNRTQKQAETHAEQDGSTTQINFLDNEEFSLDGWSAGSAELGLASLGPHVEGIQGMDEVGGDRVLDPTETMDNLRERPGFEFI